MDIYLNYWFCCIFASVEKDNNAQQAAAELETADSIDVPSTSIAEVGNTEVVVEARLNSDQDDMDLVTNNEPRKFAFIFFINIFKKD